jgi:hypothetical protein
LIVSAPDGVSWRVRVVWEPRWRALARRYGGWRRRRGGRRGGDGFDVPDTTGFGGGGGGHRGGGGFDLGDDLVVGLAIVVGLIVFGLLFWWLLLPLLLLVVDMVVVVVLVVAGVVGRVLLRRPWTIRAVAGPGTGPVTIRVVGWRAARRARDELADRLRAGLPAVGTDRKLPG